MKRTSKLMFTGAAALALGMLGGCATVPRGPVTLREDVVVIGAAHLAGSVPKSKINQKGYDSLTEEEKDLLRRASEEDL